MLILACTHFFAQQRITLDDMRQRYAEFASQQPIDTTISRENDEVVISSYHCYEKKGQKYKNPRMDKDYAYMLVEKLRTPEYPDRRHYWSLVDYEKVNHHVSKNISHKTPIERRRLKYVHKSFVRYLALDSIDGIGPSLWPKAFKRKYYRPKHKFHYAKAVSDSLFLLNEVRNMLGYTIAPHFEDAVIKKGNTVVTDNYDITYVSGNLTITLPMAKITKHPTVRTNLKYDGQLNEQALVNPGEAETRMEYNVLRIADGNGNRLKEGDRYVDEITPYEGYGNDYTAWESGSYYVWYRAASGNHIIASEPEYVSVNIAQIPLTVKVVDEPFPTVKNLSFP